MRSCVPTLILLALLSALPEGPHLVDAVPAVPSGARIEPVSRWSKAAVLAWDYAPRVVTWEVLKNCSTDPFLLTTIRVAEPTLVDDRVASHERCTYRVQACDLDGCSQPAAAVHAVFGSVPGPPAGVIAVRPSLPNTLTARYLPPADSGAGDAATVALTNFRVEVSRDPSFSRVDAATESGDGAVWVQSLRVLKGSRYYTRVSAANAMGFGPPAYYTGANGTLAPPLPALDPTTGADHLPTDPRGRMVSACAGATNGNGSEPCVTVRAVGTPASPSYVNAQAAPRDMQEGVNLAHPVVNLALAVTWLAPLDTGCGDTTEDVHSYLVEADESPRFDSAVSADGHDDHEAGPSTRIQTEVPGNASSAILHPLRRGARYHVRVRAANVVGYGDPRVLGARTPVGTAPLTAPDPPTVVGGWASAPGEISWAFVAPADKGGGPLLGYRAEISASPDFLAVLHTCTLFTQARPSDSAPQPMAGGGADARGGERDLGWWGQLGDEVRDQVARGTVYVAAFPALEKGGYYYFRVLAETAGGVSRPGVSGFPIPGPASEADGGLARVGGSLRWGEHLESASPSPTSGSLNLGGRLEEYLLSSGRWPVAARNGGASRLGGGNGGRWGDYLESAVVPCGVGVIGDVEECGTFSAAGAGVASFHRGLRAFYRFDSREGLGVDSSGDYMHARLVGNVTRGVGRIGYGASFPGSEGTDSLGSYLEIPNVLRLCYEEACVRLENGTRALCLPPHCLPALPRPEAGPLGEGGYGTAEGGAAPTINVGFRSWAINFWFAAHDTGRTQVLLAMFGRRWGEQPNGQSFSYSASGGDQASAAAADLLRANLAVWVEGRRLVVVVMGVKFDAQAACGELSEGYADGLACFPVSRAPLVDFKAYMVTLSFDRTNRVLSIHLDGHLYAEIPSAPLLDPRSGQITFGGCKCTFGALTPRMLNLRGSLDSLRLYDRAIPGSNHASSLERRTLPREPLGHLRTSASVEELWRVVHRELPFPVQAIGVPSAPSAITSVRTWNPGELWVQVAVPWDSGDGLCVLEGLPDCASTDSTIVGKCQQGEYLPCAAVIRYRLEIDDSADFTDLDFSQEYDAPGFSPPPGSSAGGPGMSRSGAPGPEAGRPAQRERAEAVVDSARPAVPSEGYGAAAGNRTNVRMYAAGLPLGRLFFIRVFAANVVGWGPPQTLSIKDGVPTSVRISGPFFLQRNSQGVFQYETDALHDPRHWGEL